jgi:uncharacterized membrane protein YdjX (TVP38/TMEM64 family)
MPGPQPDSTTDAVQAAPRSGLWPRIALLGALAAAVGVFYATGLNERLKWNELRQHLDDYRSEVAENQSLALLVFLGVYVSVTALSLPVAVWLSLLAGALFGRWLGTGVVILAATLGATLAFLASRYLFRASFQTRFGSRLSAFNDGIEREGAYYLLTLRLIPLFPFWLINLGMGLTSMRVLTFAGVSLVGMLPGTFLYVNAGTELATFRLSLPVFGSLALLGILPLVMRRMIPHRRPSRP